MATETIMPGTSTTFTEADMMGSSWMDLLENNRVELVAALRPQRYFDLLRSKGLLDESDCEEIVCPSLRPTRALQAGHFLDTIKMRGKPAFKLLLDCIEADHPDLFSFLTGKDPRPRVPIILPSKPSPSEDHNVNLLESYMAEKRISIALRQDVKALQRNLDRASEARNRCRHEVETLRKELETWESERGELAKLRTENQWKQEQIYNLQAKAFEVQNELLVANDNIRKTKLHNNELEIKLREAKARAAFHRKKSTRLEKEKSESDEMMKEGKTLKDLVDRLRLELEKEKIKVAQESVEVSNVSDKLYDQTRIDIMLSDKQEALMKCEDAVRDLHSVRTQLYDAQETRGKFQAKNEELEAKVTLLEEELDMVTERLQMAQDELEQVGIERSQAIKDRNQSIDEAAKSMYERDNLVTKLNSERKACIAKSRRLYECKTKLDRVKRELKSYQDRPGSLISSDGSCDSGSKPSSATTDQLGSATDQQNGAQLAASQGPSTAAAVFSAAIAANATGNETHRSISLANTQQQNIEEDEDHLSDYDYPTAPRERARRVQESNAMIVRRTSDQNVSHASTDVGGETDHKTVERAFSGNEHWPGFDHDIQTDTANYGTSAAVRFRRGIPSTESVEVQVGSLKDKTRQPAPRWSSCEFDIRGTNYMSDLYLARNRRSRTVGDDPDADPDFEAYPTEENVSTRF